MVPDIDPALPIEQRIAAAVADLGEAGVVTRALALIAGQNAGEEFLLTVGGEHAQGILDGAPVLYWPELWGMRALLYVWNDTAVIAVTAGLQNQAWRVREMCSRVAGARSLPVAAEARELLTDDNARVRAAGAKLLGEVGEASDVELLKNLFRDAEIDVRRAAQQAIARLEKK